MAKNEIQEWIDGSIALNKKGGLMGFLKTKKDTGAQYLAIPIEKNGIHISEKGVAYLNIKIAVYKEDDEYENSGFVSTKPVMSEGKKWADLTDEEKEEQKKKSVVIGNIKKWRQSSHQPEPTESNEDDEDDLPF